MVFTAVRALLLSSLLLLVSCYEQTELQRFDAASLQLENRNGIVYYEGSPFSGIVYRLNHRNDTKAVTGYYNGKEHGEWKRFFENGRLEEMRYYDKGMKIKTLSRWWENGRKRFQCNFKDGEYEGVLQEWNSNGQLIREMHYRNGYEDGSQKVYYDNGKIRNNYVVKNGKRTGLLGTKNCVNVADSVFKN